jgi:hypothetical protein
MSQRSRRARFLGVSLIIFAAVSCGEGLDRPTATGTGTGTGTSPTNVPNVSSATAPRTFASSVSVSSRGTRSSAAPSHRNLPPALIGIWSGGDGKSLTFTPGGRYQSNTALGDGWAVVSGGQITLTPDGRATVSTTWSVSGGKLYLGNSVYLRNDAGSDSLSLVGLWIAADGFAQFRFNADGTYTFSDPAHVRASHGSFVVDGRSLTLQPSGRPPASFGLDYDGTSLSFINPGGSSAGRYVRAG